MLTSSGKKGKHGKKEKMAKRRLKKLEKYVKKFHRYICAQNEEDSFFDLFRALDTGAEVC